MISTYELRRITPARLARVMAWVVGAIFLAICLLMIPAFLLAPLPVGSEGQPPRALFLIFLVFYPLIGALWAWVLGQVGARVYNFVAKRKGGITFDADRLERSPD